MYTQKTQTMSFRLPNDIVKALRSRVEETGESRTSVVSNALRTALGLPIEEAESPLTKRIAELELKVELLERHCHIRCD